MFRLQIFCASILLVAVGCAGSRATSSGTQAGVDAATLSSTVRPQDDFFQYVNRQWLEKTEIPADRAEYGSFAEVGERSESQLKAIVDSLAKDTSPSDPGVRKVADFYRSYMDTARIEALGVKPIQALLDQVDGIEDKKALARMFGALDRIGVPAPVELFVNQDAKNSTAYIAYLEQSGLGLPDRDFYFKDSESMVRVRKAYRTYVDRLRALTASKPDVSTETLMQLEKKLAEAHWLRVALRDPEKVYNKRTAAALQAMTPALDWAQYFHGARVKSPASVIVRQPSFLESLSTIVADTPLNVWRAYLKLRIADTFASHLDKRFVDAHFDFRQKVLSGQKEPRPRWKRAVRALDEVLGEALGRVYVKKHFPPEAKARMQTLVDNLIKGFGAGIDGLEWMTDETKAQAKVKLSKFVTKIGYPEKWRDYSALEISADDLVGNTQRGQAFEHDRRVNLLGGPIDRGEWFMRPYTVNAYYNSRMNEIVFPAAILQPPFFDLSADDAINYGAIGAAIGHELSHGFDDQGRKSDGDGNLRDWWSKQDADEFNKRAEQMVEQYNAYEPLPGKKVNGKLTLGENIGDLGGLTIAYRAYRLSLGGKEAPVIDGLTGDQRFFIGWAQVWRRKYRDAELERRLIVDPHSPAKFRVIGILSNMPEFYRVYEVKEGDGMYLPPERRIKIW